jgi:hypothetical protein
VCDLETSRMGAPYIYDISHLRVKCAYQRFYTPDIIRFHRILVIGLQSVIIGMS